MGKGPYEGPCALSRAIVLTLMMLCIALLLGGIS